jgi:lipopolysaccharide/colanic/teichoic acid biosynthesis glycosyltransferase
MTDLKHLAKRTIDVLGGCVALVLLSPVLSAAALAVKLYDGGPVVYRRRCVGQRGEFDAFKIRSMRVDADRYLEERPDLRREFEKNYKLGADPRVTPIGAFLRKASIDELPQLINVLRGEMSLVGPRMITKPELSKYGSDAGALLTVKPGMTGYWQVAGRQEVKYASRVEMDMYYIRNWSLALDMAILLKTPLKVLKREGAH